jgi:hypothetical protein
MKEHSTYKPKSWLKIQPPPIFRPSEKDRSTPTLGVTTQALTGAVWSTHEVSIGRSRIHQAFASSQHKHLDHVACRPLRSFSTRPDPVSARRASGLSFVAQPSNPDGFVVNRHKPRGLGAASTPIPLMTWPPRRLGSVLVLWTKPTKPRMQTSVVSRYPTPAPPWF